MIGFIKKLFVKKNPLEKDVFDIIPSYGDFTVLSDEHAEAIMEKQITLEEALNKIEKLERALDLYERERKRFRHNEPDITGAFFLAGGLGQTDENLLPQYVEICPAYGVGWTQIYEKTEKVNMFEGS